MEKKHTQDLRSVGHSAVEAGVSVARMQSAFAAVGAAPVLYLNHIAHFAAADVEAAIRFLNNPSSPNASRRLGRKVSEAQRRNEKMTKAEKEAAIAAFNAAVKNEMRNAKCSRIESIQAVARALPEIHRNFLRATHKQYR